MDALGTDLEAQAHKLTGEIASLEAAAETLRKTAGSICGAANDMDRKASRKRAKRKRVQEQLAGLAISEARNEARVRAALGAVEEDR